MMTVCNIKVPLRVNNYATKRNVLFIRGQKILAFIDAYAFIKKGAQGGQSIKLLKLWHLSGKTQVFLKGTDGVVKQDKRLFTEPCVTGVKYLGVYS